MHDWWVDIHESVAMACERGGLRERAMLAWIESLQETGPPPVTGSSGPWSETRGPNGERVLFSQLAEPLPWGETRPYGGIYIRSVVDW